MKRCNWVNLKNDKYVFYHDYEWGVPHYDDSYLFEFLLLESFQAGLSWECILNKREAFKKAFDNFDYQKIALYKEEKVEEPKTEDIAPTKLDLSILTVAELRELAKKKEIKGYSKMKKDELIESLK